MSVPTFSVTARSGDVLLGLSCVNEEHEAAANIMVRRFVPTNNLASYDVVGGK